MSITEMRIQLTVQPYYALLRIYFTEQTIVNAATSSSVLNL